MEKGNSVKDDPRYKIVQRIKKETGIELSMSIWTGMTEEELEICYQDFKKTVAKAATTLKNVVNSIPVSAIKEMREFAGLSRKLFSEKYEIPERTLISWENGTRKPPKYVITLLRQALTEDYLKSQNRVLLKRVARNEGTPEYWINPNDKVIISDMFGNLIAYDKQPDYIKEILDSHLKALDRGSNLLSEECGNLYEVFSDGVYTFHRKAYQIK